MRVSLLTEAGATAGWGHATRCSGLYDALAARGCEVRLYVEGDASAAWLLAGRDADLREWATLTEAERIARGSDACVVDSYRASRAVLERISRSSERAYFVDDLHRQDYPKGCIVNGSVGAETLEYGPRDDLLLGCEFTPLRREFWDVDPVEIRPTAKKSLVSVGGSATGLGLAIARKIRDLYPGVEVHLVSPRPDPGAGSTVQHSRLSAAELVDLMRQMDFAVSAAGQTSYELARLGLPAILVGLAENQRGNYRGWVDAGVAIPGGWTADGRELPAGLERALSEVLDLEKRRAMSTGGRAALDGQGALRIAAHVRGG